MITHEEFQSFAGSPELMQTKEEIVEFACHVAECTECAKRFKMALERQETFLEPSRQEWRHLSRSDFLRLKRENFNTAERRFDTTQASHLALCVKCAERYRRIAASDSFFPHGVRRLALVGISTLLLLSGSILLWNRKGPQGRIEENYRSSVGLGLLAPLEGATVGQYATFRWQAVPGVSEYVLTIEKKNPALVVFEHATPDNSYTMLPADANGLREGESYFWQVKATLASGRAESEKRSFVFSTKRAGLYLDFPATEQAAINESIRHRDNNVRRTLRAKLQNYEAQHTGVETADMAWVLGELGMLAYRLENVKSADGYYRSAISMWKKLNIPDPLTYGRTLTNLALTLEDSSRFAEALSTYKEACAILSSQDTPAYREKRSDCLLDSGTLYRAMGMARQARDAYVEVKDIDSRSGKAAEGGLAEVLGNLGNLYATEFRDPKTGVQYLEEAQRLQEKVAKERGRPQDSAPDTLDALADAYSKINKPHAALELYEEALKLDGELGNASSRSLETLNNMGAFYFDSLRDLSASFRCFQRALAIIQQDAKITPDQAWRTYDGLGRVYLERREFEDAEHWIDKAIRTSAELGEGLDSVEDRRRFRAARTSPYYSLALLRERHSDPARGLQAVEAGRATALLEHAAADERRRQTQTQLPLELHDPLPAGDVVIEYLDGGDVDPMLLFVLDGSQVESYELQPGRQLSDLIDAVGKDSLPDSKRDIGALSKLARAVLPQKLFLKLQSGEVKHLIVSPDGVLSRLSFSTLELSEEKGSTKYLIESTDVLVVPSLSWWRVRSRWMGKNPRRDILVVGDPDVADRECSVPADLTTVLQSNSFRFSRLPGSRRESKVVLSFGIAHSVALLGAEANHDRLGKLDLSQFKVIHFATHAISGGDLASSFILLGCQNRFDALLGREILAEKLDGQLVVLSTCNALEGEQLSQEGTDSIAYGFLVAGARNVVASRMRIRDEIAQELMTQFYRALSEGNSVEHSLRLAQLHFISRPDSNPAEWGAFAVEGMGGTLPTMTSSMMERISGVWIADFSVRWSFILFLFLILSYLGWRGIRRRVTLERK